MSHDTVPASGSGIAGNFLYIIPVAAMLAGAALTLSHLWIHDPRLAFLQPVGVCLSMSAMYLPFHMQRLEAGSFTNLGLIAIWLVTLLLGLSMGALLMFGVLDDSSVAAKQTLSVQTSAHPG